MFIIIVCGGGNLGNNLGGNFLVGCFVLATLTSTFLAYRHPPPWGCCFWVLGLLLLLSVALDMTTPLVLFPHPI